MGRTGCGFAAIRSYVNRDVPRCVSPAGNPAHIGAPVSTLTVNVYVVPIGWISCDAETGEGTPNSSGARSSQKRVQPAGSSAAVTTVYCCPRSTWYRPSEARVSSLSAGMSATCA